MLCSSVVSVREETSRAATNDLHNKPSLLLAVRSLQATNRWSQALMVFFFQCTCMYGLVAVLNTSNIFNGSSWLHSKYPFFFVVAGEKLDGRPQWPSTRCVHGTCVSHSAASSSSATCCQLCSHTKCLPEASEQLSSSPALTTSGWVFYTTASPCCWRYFHGS